MVGFFRIVIAGLGMAITFIVLGLLKKNDRTRHDGESVLSVVRRNGI